MVAETIDIRRTILMGKIRQGWDRIASAHEINWLIDTPDTLSAESQFEESAHRYLHGQCDLDEVRRMFGLWETAQLNKPKGLTLF